MIRNTKSKHKVNGPPHLTSMLVSMLRAITFPEKKGSKRGKKRGPNLVIQRTPLSELLSYKLYQKTREMVSLEASRTKKPDPAAKVKSKLVLICLSNLKADKAGKWLKATRERFCHIA